MIAAGASNAYIRLAKKEYDLIEIFEMYGPDTCKALPYFHAFTGCDTASSFFGKGKTTMFDAWMIFPKLSELNSTFIELSNSPTSVSKENLKILEEFMLFVALPLSSQPVSVFSDRKNRGSHRPTPCGSNGQNQVNRILLDH